MVSNLAGKVAVVTASTAGIGFAIAHRLAKDGAKVMISSRKQANVDSAVKMLEKEKLSVSGMVCHVAKQEDRKSLLAETKKIFGGIDIMISNAGVNPTAGSTLQTSEEVWDKIFEINVKASFLMCKDVFPFMQERGGGSIVIVSSVAGYQPIEFLGAYSVSKTALLGLVKVLLPEMSAENIRINAIAPGLIKTKFSQMLLNNVDIRETMMQQIPMRRFGEPEDCSGAVSFLVSDDANYITGECIAITGGLPSRL